jgi:hypothetical protein
MSPRACQTETEAVRHAVLLGLEASASSAEPGDRLLGLADERLDELGGR